ncbi:ATP-binding cassette domain-containing protein [Alphaproteobacteria bacterium]|nr:ATP-binding cassette domain-containing protein [Alphaproteobacteria bacterium]
MFKKNRKSEVKISPIKIKDLSISLNDRFILRNINCQINDKSITAILGPNGAGKSLLLQTINGLIPVLTGKITYNLNQLDNDIRKQQAMVFQSPTLLRRTVLGNMEFVNSINKNSNIIDLKYILKKVGLEAYNDKPARLLSGGEKQRLSLARALLIQPKLLLLDEPTANLDPYSLKLIEDLILEENSKGTTIILTTHDMSQAKRLASDIIFINKGEILEQTQAKIFFKEPQTIEAKKYLTGEILL